MSALLFAACAGAQAQALDEKPDRPQSAYAERLDRVLKAWPSRRFFSDAMRGVEITCIGTSSDEHYVGIVRRTSIHASLTAVEQVLDDVVRFKDLFPGTVDVQILSGSRSSGHFTTRWEQRVPVFFLPNAIYELTHVVDKTVSGRGIYRYALRRGEPLTASDGLVIAEAVAPQATQVTEYGFFRPRSGPVPASLVWHESVRGAYLGSMAIKLKAENPGWTYERIASESKQMASSEAGRIDRCVADRHDPTTRDEILPPGATER